VAAFRARVTDLARVGDAWVMRARATAKTIALELDAENAKPLLAAVRSSELERSVYPRCRPVRLAWAIAVETSRSRTRRFRARPPIR
jgi:hypothetical protein